MKARWTPEEVERLRTLYPKAGDAALSAAFPGRSRRSIRKRAQALGVRRDCYFWSPAQDARLREMWADCARRTIRRALGGKTWWVIKQRARHLGLTAERWPGARPPAPAPRRAPSADRWARDPQRWRGYVSVSRAAEVNCHDARVFLRVLAAYHEHFKSLPQAARDDLPSPALHVRGELGARKVQRVVDEQAARDAAAWWESQETLAKAAERMGLSYFALYNHARFLGEKPRRLDRRAPAWWDDLERRARSAMKARPGVFRAVRDRAGGAAPAEPRKAVA